MSRLCFGSFAQILKDNTALTNKETATLLINGLTDADTIDDSDKNKLFKCQIEIQYIKVAAASKKSYNTIEQYFIENVEPALNMVRISELIERIKALVNGDDTIYPNTKNELLANANKEHISGFLSTVFLFAASQPNVYKSNTIPTPSQYNTITITNDGTLLLNGEKVYLPQKLTPPTNIDNSELIYIQELLKAYADAENIDSINKDEIPSKYKQNFNDQRRYFYNAEAINRSLRDIGHEGLFDEFLQDTYDSIIDTCNLTYNNGYERLLNVLQQAANRPQGKSAIEKAIAWIGMSEKKGACHILVNQERIKWVIENE